MVRVFITAVILCGAYISLHLESSDSRQIKAEDRNDLSDIMKYPSAVLIPENIPSVSYVAFDEKKTRKELPTRKEVANLRAALPGTAYLEGHYDGWVSALNYVSQSGYEIALKEIHPGAFAFQTKSETSKAYAQGYEEGYVQARNNVKKCHKLGIDAERLMLFCENNAIDRVGIPPVPSEDKP